MRARWGSATRPPSPSRWCCSDRCSNITREQTGDAIRALLGLAPSRAHLVEDGAEKEVLLDLVWSDDRLRQAERKNAPVDGSVLEGSSSSDESMITGGPIPVDKRADDAMAIACPCALRLAKPMSIMVGVGKGSGILIK